MKQEKKKDKTRDKRSKDIKKKETLRDWSEKKETKDDLEERKKTKKL